MQKFFFTKNFHINNLTRFIFVKQCFTLKGILRLCRLSPMFLNVDQKKTSVPDVLPSGQCFKRCTAKDNADVTRSYQQTVAFMLASIRRL